MLFSANGPRPPRGGRHNRRPALVLTLTTLSMCALFTGCGNKQSAPQSAGPSPSPSHRDQPLRDAKSAKEASPSPSELAGGAQDQDFQTVLVTKGDVTVYTPVHIGAKLTVPVMIKNTTSQRVQYTVDIRVEGPGGFDTTVHLRTDVVGVYPGGTWPEELTAVDHAKPVPQHPKVTITRVERRPMFKE